MRKLELIFFGAAALLSLGVSIYLFMLITEKPLFPFPAAYFIEMPAVALAALVWDWLDRSSAGMVIGFVIGIYVAFIILGILSVGPMYILPALIMIIASSLRDMRQRQKNWLFIVFALLGAVLQAALMLLIVHFLVQ